MQSVRVRPAIHDDDRLIAQHFYRMWRDLDVPADCIEDDWCDRTLRYICEARQTIHSLPKHL
ncbi:MAG TPA: hypothetical protein ACFE0H_11970 [Elainellaceae cyanobacterium]